MTAIYLSWDRFQSSFFFVFGPFDNLIKVEAQQVTYLSIRDAALRLHDVKSVDLDAQKFGALFWCHQ
jgi:hypothetical protein